MGCKPPLGSGEVEKRKATEACRPWFESQLKKWGSDKPALVMGKWAQLAFAGTEKSVEANRGYVRALPSGRTWLGTWHPTYAFFHNPYEWGSFTVDAERFGRLIKGKLKKEVPLVWTSGDWRRLQQIYKWALKRGFFTIDLETHPVNGDTVGFTAKDPVRAGINLMSVGVPNCGLSVRWKLLSPKAKSIFKAMLADRRLAKVTQNGWWFDLPILRRYGFVTKGRVVDIRDLRRACSTTSKLSLHYMGSLFEGDNPPWKEFTDDDAKA